MSSSRLNLEEQILADVNMTVSSKEEDKLHPADEKSHCRNIFEVITILNASLF